MSFISLEFVLKKKRKVSKNQKNKDESFLAFIFYNNEIKSVKICRFLKNLLDF